MSFPLMHLLVGSFAPERISQFITNLALLIHEKTMFPFVQGCKAWIWRFIKRGVGIIQNMILCHIPYTAGGEKSLWSMMEVAKGSGIELLNAYDTEVDQGEAVRTVVSQQFEIWIFFS